MSTALTTSQSVWSKPRACDISTSIVSPKYKDRFTYQAEMKQQSQKAHPIEQYQMLHP